MLKLLIVNRQSSIFFMQKTLDQYDAALAQCASLFEKKNRDYGTAWRILRLESITDQLYIKAKRIREIQERGSQQISDSIAEEFIGLVNYSAMALAQIELGDAKHEMLDSDFAFELYKKQTNIARALMIQKNTDYGEAWRDMRISSLVDLILMKIFRLKQIEDNKGKTFVSEGVNANYLDILNYALFALIKL